MSEKNKLSTQPYKGVRDFYPEDMFVQNHIFNTWRMSCEKFGYEEYNASVLEPSEIYESKTSNEIVNEQMYSFTDRGDRQVSLRPEMTPTVARLVAGRKNEYTLPLRWFSIPNVFRYEKPQRGRLREHFQLNVDIFGVSGIEAELELLTLASTIITDFGANDKQFVIKINSRDILNGLYEKYGLGSESAFKLTQTLDKKAKLSDEVFREAVSYILGGKAEEFLELIASTPSLIDTLSEENKGIKDVVELIAGLEARGITNVEFDPTITRGFNYYTGVVFEIFDISDANPRSLFGGGRYSNLTSAYGKDEIEAVGFGFGDVVLRDFLETYDLLPEYRAPTTLLLCRVDDSEEVDTYIQTLARDLRKNDINVLVDISGKKVGDQLTFANKRNIPYTVCVGPQEISTKSLKLKNMESGEEKTLSPEELVSTLKS